MKLIGEHKMYHHSHLEAFLIKHYSITSPHSALTLPDKHVSRTVAQLIVGTVCRCRIVGTQNTYGDKCRPITTV